MRLGKLSRHPTRGRLRPPVRTAHSHTSTLLCCTLMQLRATAAVHVPFSALLSSLRDGPYMMDVALMMPWKPEGMPLA